MEDKVPIWKPLPPFLSDEIKAAIKRNCVLDELIKVRMKKSGVKRWKIKKQGN